VLKNPFKNEDVCLSISRVLLGGLHSKEFMRLRAQQARHSQLKMVSSLSVDASGFWSASSALL